MKSRKWIACSVRSVMLSVVARSDVFVLPSGLREWVGARIDRKLDDKDLVSDIR